MNSKNKRPEASTKKFDLYVTPTAECLNTSIALNGQCKPDKCWHKVAIFKEMETIAPGCAKKVRVDAGHVKLTYKDWRYIANTPLIVAKSLRLFDEGRFDLLVARPYKLSFVRTTKVVKLTAEQKKRVNANRAARIAAGGLEREKYTGPSMKDRVRGFAGTL